MEPMEFGLPLTITATPSNNCPSNIINSFKNINVFPMAKAEGICEIYSKDV
jgi:hypothetical protein